MTDISVPPDRKSPKRQTPQRESIRPKTGVRKVFDRSPQKDTSGHFKTRTSEPIEKPTDLELPPGPVIQVFSPRMRRTVDTFLMNATPVHTAFRAFLQGADGGFQGDLAGAAIADYEQEKCLAVAAILPNGIWLVHSTDRPALHRLLDLALARIKPRRIEGERATMLQVLDYPDLPVPVSKRHPKLIEYVHLELTPRKFPRGPGGRHRFAQVNDIPRLDEYSAEFQSEIGEPPPSNWRTLISENRILLAIIEGTASAVAQRGPSTLDRMRIDGVLTFKHFRRRGLARNLVSALASQAAGRGQSTSIICRKENQAMLSLLETLQFIKTADYAALVLPEAQAQEP